jgi:hypothetical protein
MAAVETMAKRKATGSRQPITTEPDEPMVRKNIVSIRGTEAWRDWLTRYAAKRRVPVTSLIDQVLAESAASDGFEAPPER